MSDPTSIELPSGSLKERCERFGIPWLDEAPELDLELAARLSPDTAVRLRIVPYAVKDGWARAIMADPMDLSAADEASASLGLPVQREGIDTERFNDLVRRAYGTTAARMAEDLAGEAEENDYEHNLDAIEADDIHRMAEQPTLINLVNLLLIEAIQSRTSDVHVEPFESELKIKYRIDGELVEQSPPPKHLQPR